MQPFSFGPRNCIGRKLVSQRPFSGPSWHSILSSLAYVEMRIILARMIFNFDMELDPASNDWMNQDAFILWEKPELMVKLTPRTWSRSMVVITGLSQPWMCGIFDSAFRLSHLSNWTCCIGISIVFFYHKSNRFCCSQFVLVQCQSSSNKNTYHVSNLSANARPNRSFIHRS